MFSMFKRKFVKKEDDGRSFNEKFREGSDDLRVEDGTIGGNSTAVKTIN